MTTIIAATSVGKSEYAQSANTLFHFMKKKEYLVSALNKKALIPRYCKETIDYLDLKANGGTIKEIGILQKCFCDIPLHQIYQNIQVVPLGDNFKKLDYDSKEDILKNNTHPDFYGKYALSFSKYWAESHNIQPIHYINPKSEYSKDFKKLFESIIVNDDLSEIVVDDIISRFSFLKPLYGIMERFAKDGSTIELSKNFYDECEWRYVPSKEQLSKAKLDKIIVKKELLGRTNKINSNIEDIQYEDLWLKFDYSDIKYIIVPNNSERIDFISEILSLPDNLFENTGTVTLEKHMLISKILVLDEIRKDW